MGTSELSGKPDEVVRGNLAIDWHPIQEEVVIFLVASYKGMGLGGALGASTELTNLT